MLAGIALVAFLLVNQLGGARQLGWLVALPLVASSYMVISGIFGICIVHSLKGNRQADHGPEVRVGSSEPSAHAHAGAAGRVRERDHRLQLRCRVRVARLIRVPCRVSRAAVSHPAADRGKVLAWAEWTSERAPSLFCGVLALAIAVSVLLKGQATATTTVLHRLGG